MNQRGNILISSVVFVFVIGIFGFAFLSFSRYEIEAVNHELNRLRMFWKAEEALSMAAAQMNQESSLDNLDGETDVTHNFKARYSVSRLDEKRQEEYAITAEVYADKEPNKVLLTLVAKEQAINPAARYGFFEDHAGQPFYDTGDTIDGPIHTNTRFKITNSPVFTGELFESGYPEEINGFIRREFSPFDPQIVGATPVWGAPKYSIEHMAALIQTVTPAIAVPGDKIALLELKGNHYQLRYQQRSNPNMMTPPVLLPLPDSEGLYFDGEVNIKGILNGRLTIGASGNIAIIDDLIYHDSDPATGRPALNATSVLGLISAKNVKVNQTQAADEIGRGIRINAAIVAINKSFEVANYRQTQYSMGSMHLWGSIIQFERGIIGSVRLRGRIARGYIKNWHYDRRLKTRPPAYFPPLIDSQGRKRFRTVYWGRPGV